jgi:m7GpppX diphosphatase
VPMLRDIQTGVLAKLREAYGVEPHSVRAYMHYLPSFWWAHIHFSALTCPNLGVTTSVGKAILLDDIIDHLERDSSFFANANLTICIGEKDPLFSRLEHGGFTQTSSPRPAKMPKTKN